nr:hypothetical protein HK105_005914 [Polyrhizophydium stewartii]
MTSGASGGSDSAEASTSGAMMMTISRTRAKPFIMDDLDSDLQTLGVQRDLVGLTPLLPASRAVLESKHNIDPAMLLELLSVFQFYDAFGSDVLGYERIKGFSFGMVVGALRHLDTHYSLLLGMYSTALRKMEKDAPTDMILVQSFLGEYIRELLPEAAAILNQVEAPEVSIRTHIAILSQLVAWLTEMPEFHQHISSVDAIVASLRKTSSDRQPVIQETLASISAMDAQLDDYSSKIDILEADIRRVVQFGLEAHDAGDPAGIAAASNGGAAPPVAEPIVNGVPTAKTDSSETPAETAGARRNVRQQARAKAEAEREYLQKLRSQLSELLREYNSRIAARDSAVRKIDSLETDDFEDRHRIMSLSSVSKGLGEALLGFDRYGRAYWWITVEPEKLLTYSARHAGHSSVQKRRREPTSATASSAESPSGTLSDAGDGDETPAATMATAAAKPTPESGGAALRKSEGSRDKLWDGDPPPPRYAPSQVYGVIVEHSFSAHDENDPTLAQFTTGWSYFETLEDLYAFSSSLCIRGIRERSLRAAIERRFLDLRLPQARDMEPRAAPESAQAAYETASRAFRDFARWLLGVTGGLPRDATTGAFCTDPAVIEALVAETSASVEFIAPPPPVQCEPFTQHFGFVARDKLFELGTLCEIESGLLDKIRDGSFVPSIENLKAAVHAWWQSPSVANLTLGHIEALEQVSTLSGLYEWCCDSQDEITDEIERAEETMEMEREREQREALREQQLNQKTTHHKPAKKRKRSLRDSIARRRDNVEAAPSDNGEEARNASDNDEADARRSEDLDTSIDVDNSLGMDPANGSKAQSQQESGRALVHD